MNKSELTAQLKQNADIITDILKAAQLPPDLEDFTSEQVLVCEEIVQLVSSGQAKTYKVAGEIYRKPINEAQLEEIAFRHTIAHDRISEILAGMKLKPETLTDEDLTHFESVCQQIQSGIALEMAVQSVAPSKQTKGKKANAQALPEFVSQSEQAGAITSANNGPMLGLITQDNPASIEGINLDTDMANQWRETSAEEALASSDAIAKAPFDGIYEAADQVNQQIAPLKEYGKKLFNQELSNRLNDPAYVQAIASEQRAKRKASREAEATRGTNDKQ